MLKYLHEMNCLVGRIKLDIQAQREEIALGAKIGYTEKGAYIDTRISRDPERSHNGGEYNFWTNYLVRDGGVLVEWCWSADFDINEEPEFYTLDLSVYELHDLIKEIEQNIQNQIE